MKAATNTLKTAARTCAALLTAGLLSSTAFAADTPATVPTSFLGTYNLTYANAQSGSPITNGTAVTVVIAANNTLCLGGYTLTNPVIRNDNGHEAIWTESSLGIEIALSSLLTGFNEINVGKVGGTFYGQLQGSKSSTSTSGCGASTPEPDLTQINELFAQAQAKLAQYFPPSANAVNQTLDGYVYRFYPSTNIYLAIKDGQVALLGGTFGDQPVNVGSLQDVFAELAKINVDTPIPSGDATLVITGTVGTSGINVNIGTITIDNLPMPSEGNVNDIEDLVRKQFKDSGITGTISVTLLSSSSSSIVYNIKFSGSTTQSGFTFTQLYDITFTYTKK